MISVLSRPVGAEGVGLDQLDGGGAHQEPVGGLPDLAHAAAGDQLAQDIAPHLAGLAHFPAEAGDDVGDDRRHGGAEVVGDGEEEDLLEAHRLGTERSPDHGARRSHTGGGQGSGQGFSRGARHDRREEQDDDRDPGDSLGRTLLGVVQDPHRERGEDLVDQRQVKDELGTSGVVASEPEEAEGPENVEGDDGIVERAPFPVRRHPPRREGAGDGVDVVQEQEVGASTPGR